MTEFQSLNALAGLASALGAIAVYRFNLEQSRKARAELLENLDSALEHGRKHTACELFRMLHALRMDFEDIEAICHSSKVSKIILALQKAPGMVKLENGRFQYHGIFSKQWVRTFDKYAMRTLAGVMGGITVSLIIWMSFLRGPASLAMSIIVIPLAAFFAMQLKDIRQDRMIESLVDDNVDENAT